MDQLYLPEVKLKHWLVTTLGTSDDEQRIESLEGQKRVRFMLHYNFPPFSVGETGRIGTGRREVGHGKVSLESYKFFIA